MFMLFSVCQHTRTDSQSNAHMCCQQQIVIHFYVTVANVNGCRSIDYNCLAVTTSDCIDGHSSGTSNETRMVNNPSPIILQWHNHYESNNQVHN